MTRHSNGEGTIYRRKDGRYEGAVSVPTTTGGSKRIRMYGKTRADVHEKLTAVKRSTQQGIATSERVWKLGNYLDYWLENVVRLNRRPATYELYEANVRLDLKPGLGKYPLTRLSVPIVQAFLNKRLADGCSVRKVQVIRTALSAALTRAHREELVTRNVARLVELPQWQRAEFEPWSLDEVTQFLEVAEGYALHPAFVLLVVYGLRRGEVLGLRWRDIDFEDSVIRVCQQLQRRSGTLLLGPVKTKAGERRLPLHAMTREALELQQGRQAAARKAAGDAWHETLTADELVFTTSTGRPVEPHNFSRSFRRICEEHGIRLSTVHHVRHTTATLLKDLGVQARDAQLILGHSHVSTTQQIYQHDDMDSRREALGRVEAALSGSLIERPRLPWHREARQRCRQLLPSKEELLEYVIWVLCGGPRETRTLDTLLKSSILTRADPKITEAMLVLKDCLRQSFLGGVAVNYCRQMVEDFCAPHVPGGHSPEYDRHSVAANASSLHKAPANSNALPNTWVTRPGIRGC